jgi:hypothetical protein
MPRGGAVTLADVREPTIEIVGERCGRYGHYNVNAAAVSARRRRRSSCWS